LEVGDLRHPVPWALEVARFLAPFLVAYAATKAILAIFHEQAAMVRMRFFRRHAVVCGLGEMGRLLATSLHEAGHRVVAVELNPDNTYVASVRARGIGVLRGDATDPLLLHRAGVGRAAQVFGVCGDDRINAEVAARCRELASNRSTEGLSCFCHIAEPYHAELLREREIEARSTSW
jgi:voltage-gated potassium channel Kch